EFNVPPPPPFQNLYLPGITAGPEGNIWFTENHDPYTSSQIGVFNPSSDTFDQYAVPGGRYPGAITVGPDHNLWFTANFYGVASVEYIDEVTTGGAFTVYALQNAGAVGLASGSDGNIWFTGTPLYEGQPTVVGVITLSPAATPTQLAVTTQPPGAA